MDKNTESKEQETTAVAEQVRALTVALLDDDYGINDAAFAALQGLVAKFPDTRVESLLAQTRGTDGRHYLPCGVLETTS